MKVKVADGLVVNNFSFDLKKVFDIPKASNYPVLITEPNIKIRGKSNLSNNKPKSGTSTASNSNKTVRNFSSVFKKKVFLHQSLKDAARVPTESEFAENFHTIQHGDVGEYRYTEDDYSHKLELNVNKINVDKNYRDKIPSKFKTLQNNNKNSTINSSNSKTIESLDNHQTTSTTNMIPSMKTSSILTKVKGNYYMQTENASRNFYLTSRSNNTITHPNYIANVTTPNFTSPNQNTINSPTIFRSTQRLIFARKMILKTVADKNIHFADQEGNFSPNRDSPFEKPSTSHAFRQVTLRNLSSANYLPNLTKFDNYRKTTITDNKKYYEEIVTSNKRRKVKFKDENAQGFFQTSMPNHFNHVLYSKGNNLISKILKRDRKIEPEKIIFK